MRKKSKDGAIVGATVGLFTGGLGGAILGGIGGAILGDQLDPIKEKFKYNKYPKRR